MSALVPQANYAPSPNGYEKIGPGHYRRREDDPEARAAERAIQFLTESEVRPCTCHPDDNPPIPCAQKYALSDCMAPQANRLDQIAMLVCALTYGEMMDLAAALWKAHDETSQEDELTEKDLPGMWHRWAKEDIKP